jgi:hypothetical protein
LTPLDRILDRFSGAREVLFRLGEYLPLIVVVALVMLIVLVVYWAFVASPRRAVRILKGLDREGYGPVAPEDPKLKEALERLTPNIFHTYELSTVTKTSPWRVKLAFARHDGRASRYFALINRSVSRAAPASTILEHQFTIAFLESRVLPFNQDVHVAGDGYTLDRGYGLRTVPEDTLGRLSSGYVVHTRDGTLDPLPTDLQDALMGSAPFLSIQAATGNREEPFLFHARLRFTPAGWGLISNEFVYHQRKMVALVEVVDRVSRSLP